MLPAAAVHDRGTLVWDPAADFRPSPGQVNPNPDSYGSDGVWSYLASADLDHDPDRYSPLSHYSIIDSGRQQWDSPEFVNLLVAHLSGERRLLLHAFGGHGSGVRSAILGWRSPVSGQVTVQGTVELSDTSCAAMNGGIVFWIDQGAHTLERFVIAAGGRQHLSLETTVEANEFLYFVTDPGLDSNCDTTLLALSIQADAPEVPDTAMPASPDHGRHPVHPGWRAAARGAGMPRGAPALDSCLGPSRLIATARVPLQRVALAVTELGAANAQPVREAYPEGPQSRRRERQSR
jgi:hypothetical protein